MSVNQGLVTSTFRICKHNVTIPRVELISTHIWANSVENVNLALQNQNTRSVTGWTNNSRRTLDKQVRKLQTICLE